MITDQLAEAARDRALDKLAERWEQRRRRPNPEDGNVISGNLTGEVDVQEGAGNLAQGNRLGTDAAGARSLGSGTGVIRVS